MSQEIENLSALVDGEELSFNTKSTNAIDSLKGDANLQQKWQRYHLIRDTLRQELPKELNFDISAKVAQAIENEPAILAPNKKSWRDLPLVANVIPFAKQGGQMAIAASVAVAMIIGVQQVNQSNTVQPFNSAAPIMSVQGGLSPVSFDQTRAIPNSDGLEQKRRINAFMADHKQQLRFKTVHMPQTKPALNLDPTTQEAQSDVVENTPQ
ncbi:sigma-E factor negative regulatory protein [Paraglaciecola aestuariivivens]